MTRDEFKQILCDESYSFYEKDEWIIVNIENSIFLSSLKKLPDNIQFNNKGSVFLPSLAESPDNIQFNNEGSVFLPSLTELSGNIQFNNEGRVYLGSLTELSGNIQFNNGWNVYLRSLKKLSDNIQFNNKGIVYLVSLTELPDNFQFNNKGSVYLDSLPEGQYEYQGQSIYLKNIDGFTMIIDKTKSINEMKVHICRYFDGGPIVQLKKYYVSESNGLYAHGLTAKAAIEDLKCKLSKNSLH